MSGESDQKGEWSINHEFGASRRCEQAGQRVFRDWDKVSMNNVRDHRNGEPGHQHRAPRSMLGHRRGTEARVVTGTTVAVWRRRRVGIRMRRSTLGAQHWTRECRRREKGNQHQPEEHRDDPSIRASACQQSGYRKDCGWPFIRRDERLAAGPALLLMTALTATIADR